MTVCFYTLLINILFWKKFFFLELFLIFYFKIYSITLDPERDPNWTKTSGSMNLDPQHCWLPGSYLTTVTRLPGGIFTTLSHKICKKQTTESKKCSVGVGGVRRRRRRGNDCCGYPPLLLGDEGVGNGLHTVHRAYQHHSRPSIINDRYEECTATTIS